MPSRLCDWCTQRPWWIGYWRTRVQAERFRLCVGHRRDTEWCCAPRSEQRPSLLRLSNKFKPFARRGTYPDSEFRFHLGLHVVRNDTVPSRARGHERRLDILHDEEALHMARAFSDAHDNTPVTAAMGLSARMLTLSCDHCSGSSFVPQKPARLHAQSALYFRRKLSNLRAFASMAVE